MTALSNELFQHGCSVDREPDTCPRCNRGIDPELKTTSYTYKDNRLERLQVAYRCPRHECAEIFIANYICMLRVCHLKSVSPKKHEPREYPTEITGVSTQYSEIFNQSAAAEANDLTLIAGCGYRKALEYLIKDYCIQKMPDQEDKIKKMFLGNVIDKFVSDTTLKEVVKRAVWLGNDESHYTRKFVDKDVQDLKEILQLTEYWICHDVKTQQLLKEMTPA
uniref:DUF4145 domain-containing protein n=1 Tax=Microbulbifer agarilyticus TaxID=260552 RepID=UPI000255917B|nr:DUF4145 domain-containing protein [Microbulbifer agarilyticus]